MKCNQCEAMMINGVFCHEHGCPNSNARYDSETETWIKQYTCDICGYEVDEGETCSCYEVMEEDLYTSL